MRTIRSPFTGGQHAEEGAARIPTSHTLTLEFAQHFGLELDPFYPGQGLHLDVAGGHRSLTSANPITGSPELWYKIRGGTDLLPKAFAAELGPRVHFEAPVIRIENGDATASVFYEEGGVERTITARRVLCTVPFPVLMTPPRTVGCWARSIPGWTRRPGPGAGWEPPRRPRPRT